MKDIDRIVFLDMDGTIADLYGNPDWLDILRSQDPDNIYKLFRDLEPLISGHDLWRYCCSIANLPVVFSMTPLDASADAIKACIDGKLDWLDHHFPWLKNRIITDFGPSKDAKAILKAGWLELPDVSVDRIMPRQGDILVDDNETLRNNWKYGLAIVPFWIK